MIPTNDQIQLAHTLLKVQDLEERLAIAKRGLHILSIRYGTEGLAARYLEAIEAHEYREIGYHD